MPDDLRAAFVYAAQCWYADGMVNGREYGELADALLAVLPEHGREVLSLVVREGTAAVALTREQWAQVMVALYAGTQESVLTDEQADAIEAAILKATGPLEDRHHRPREADDLRTELRNDFAQTLAAFDGYDDEPEESIAADYLARADELIEMLPSLVRPQEKREGWASATELAEDGLLLIVPRRLRGVNTLDEDDVPVIVTWEATDAR